MDATFLQEEEDSSSDEDPRGTRKEGVARELYDRLAGGKTQEATADLQTAAGKQAAAAPVSSPDDPVKRRGRTVMAAMTSMLRTPKVTTPREGDSLCPISQRYWHRLYPSYTHPLLRSQREEREVMRRGTALLTAQQ